MVLPVRIELTTSALPRMRSTTELRQHDHSGRASMRTPGTRAYGLCGRQMSSRLPAPADIRYVTAMRESEAERRHRLAEALRANLRRRKAQARDGTRDEDRTVEPPEN